MNATQLLAHFDRLSEAPGAVPRLRRFILDLAVRGKLVEQDPKDEPAAVLLKRIQAKSARLQGEGRIKKARSFPTAANDFPPFPAPFGWLWTSLDTFAELITDGEHISPVKTQGGMLLLTAKHIRDWGVSLDSPQYVSHDDGVKFRERCAPKFGDVLICSRGTIGRCCVMALDTIFCLMGSVILVRPSAELLPQYLDCFLKSDEGQFFIRGATKGMAVNALYLKDIRLCPIPLPPLAEQHRIVTKVDELMALCDQLEAAQQERERRRDRLATASLQRLNQPAAATDSETQREHARFHLHHLPRLTTRPEHIKALRQTILNLAVLGSLSESKDWALHSQPLKTAATLQNGYAFKSEWFTKTGIRLLRNTNVSHGVIRCDELACLPVEQAEEFERFKLIEGDVVLSLDRPFIGTGTKVARVQATDLPCLLLQRVGRFQLNPNLLTPDYLFLWIESPQFTEQIDPGRSNGVPHISSKQVESAEIFLPPLAEQHRIVAKVDELMALCDQLEAQLTTTQTDSRRLLEAMLDAALAPA